MQVPSEGDTVQLPVHRLEKKNAPTFIFIDWKLLDPSFVSAPNAGIGNGPNNVPTVPVADTSVPTYGTVAASARCAPRLNDAKTISNGTAESREYLLNFIVSSKRLIASNFICIAIPAKY